MKKRKLIFATAISYLLISGIANISPQLNFRDPIRKAIPEGITFEQLTSISNIDQKAKYVLGLVDNNNGEFKFHSSGTSSWGVITDYANADYSPILYSLTKNANNTNFKASAKISNTTYYLQVPTGTKNTFSMSTLQTDDNTDLIIGTTQISETNYAIANSGTPARHLRINGASGLRSYASTTGQMAFFYKVVEENASPTANIEKTTPIANLVFTVNSEVNETLYQGYQKVINDQDDWSGEYLIVSENNEVCFNSSLETLDVSSNNTAISEESEGLIPQSQELNSKLVTITKIDGGYAIQASNGQYIGHSGNSNALNVSDTQTYFTNSISVGQNGNTDIQCGSYFLRYNKASGQERFRYYSSNSSQDPITLYKKISNTTYTPKNVKTNLGVILDKTNVLELENSIVSYGVAVAKQGSLGENKLNTVLNESYVGKSEVTLANTPFVYCDSQGRVSGDEGFVDNTDDYIIFSANLAIPEANYTTELTWAAYFILDDEDHSVVMTRERTESVKSLAEQYKTKEDYNDYSDEIKACIDYLAKAN